MNEVLILMCTSGSGVLVEPLRAPPSIGCVSDVVGCPPTCRPEATLGRLLPSELMFSSGVLVGRTMLLVEWALLAPWDLRPS